MTLFGLPLGSVIALSAVVALPIASYILYRIDVDRADGHVTILGYRKSTRD